MDFSLIAGNPFYLATLGLSLIGWIITFAGTAAANNILKQLAFEGISWFFIVFELFLILGIAAAIATDSVRHYRFTILTFLGFSLVQIVDIITRTIQSDQSQFQAIAAGTIFLSIVTFVWIFSFGSEEGSIVVNTINSLAINKVDNRNIPGHHHITGGFPPSGPIAMMPTSTHESNSNPVTVAVSPNVEYAYKAKALYDYQANPDDQNELSFSKGETLDIADNKGKWWQARKADGSVGIAPSNYLQII